MTQVKQEQEPSMEEILASIRRIISDEGDGAKAPAEAAEEVAGGGEMSQDDLDALFDTPAEAPAEEPAASDEPMSQDDLDALFDSPAPAEPEAADETDDDVLTLTEDLAVDDDEDMMPEESDVAFVEQEEDEPEPEPEAVFEAEPVSEPEPVDEEERLLSPLTDAAASAAFSNLANTILSNNARTLEDLVREMLRPMLKSWLDDNLPTLVERLVRQEIERVSRGR